MRLIRRRPFRLERGHRDDCGVLMGSGIGRSRFGRQATCCREHGPRYRHGRAWPTDWFTFTVVTSIHIDGGGGVSLYSSSQTPPSLPPAANLVFCVFRVFFYCLFVRICVYPCNTTMMVHARQVVCHEFVVIMITIIVYVTFFFSSNVATAQRCVHTQ